MPDSRGVQLSQRCSLCCSSTFHGDSRSKFMIAKNDGAPTASQNLDPWRRQHAWTCGTADVKAPGSGRCAYHRFLSSFSLPPGTRLYSRIGLKQFTSADEADDTVCQAVCSIIGFMCHRWPYTGTSFMHRILSGCEKRTMRDGGCGTITFS